MPVQLISCGPVANESEAKSFNHIKTCLISEAKGQDWILLTNLAFSITHDLKSDEIDLIVIGPGGVRVVEIKHWTGSWIKANRQRVEDEAERLLAKTRKVATTLRKVVPELPFVPGVFLLSQEPNLVKDVVGQTFRGATLYGLKDWKKVVGFDEPAVLSSQQIDRLARHLQPRKMAAHEGSLRRLAGYVNLELRSPKEERFHRIYVGKHPQRRDKVVLHLFDLSAEKGPHAEEKARRGFDALHRLQLYPWAPRILDSFQEVPGFPGEMYFYTLVDPEAPTLAERVQDETWKPMDRIAYARASIQAVSELHTADPESPLVHRNITPSTLLVKHDNTPILTGFEYTRIPSEISIASSSPPTHGDTTVLAPEVRAYGRKAADQRSDIYALCASLSLLFENADDELSSQARHILKRGMAAEPRQRASLEELAEELSKLLGESVPKSAPPPARFWTEDQVVVFRDNRYRIVSRLGSGGIGTAFKVVQLDPMTGEEMGTFVAKVAHDAHKGEQIRRAYNLVRSHLGHTGLSTVFEVAPTWQENQFVALMKWVPGTPLMDYKGVFPLLAEDLQELSAQDLALRWLRDICNALDVLHSNGLIHGDVSPRNLIVSGSEIVLTDYDFVQKIGEPRHGLGTPLYCAPAYPTQPASPSDDIFALAASFFHVLFDQEPFQSSELTTKAGGLRWEGISDDEYPRLRSFFEKATHSDPKQRFQSVEEVISWLFPEPEPEKTVDTVAPEPTPIPQVKAEILPPDIPTQGSSQTLSRAGLNRQNLREQHVDWLQWVLQSYPGSRWGNQETRGLDSDFASQTYVETALERTLIRDIRERRVRLVILCGNAGDGKTALLQHLAAQLGLGERKSAERILEGQAIDGPLVRINLDGSAAWQGRSADELLDEFLQPFFDGPPGEDIFHLLAINDGRLLEWIETARRTYGERKLFSALYRMLNREPIEQPYIRFINLNERSLVGGIISLDPGAGARQIRTAFLDQLVDRLYGGERAGEIWEPCLSCTAQDRCQVFRAARVFGPDSMPDLAEDSLRIHARKRLFEALQAVHLRGETHITVRELRAALVYILFGIHYCDDYHTGEQQAEILPYWDRAFQPDSPLRQGEVLGELVRFDPALEAHPQTDRALSRHFAAEDGGEERPLGQQLASARRWAYFEWPIEKIEQIAQDPHALGLANGKYLDVFRRLPFMDEHERQEICAKLCAGIARLEELPPQALQRKDVVPLRIAQRTPTETAFWVEKPLSRFRLEVDLPPETEGIEQLHRQISLIYRYANGQEERLQMGANLFHLLLDLAEGYQLGDVSTDDTFTRLSIFVQRLVREDEQTLFGWTPIKDESVYRISAVVRQTPEGPRQQMEITSLMEMEEAVNG